MNRRSNQVEGSLSFAEHFTLKNPNTPNLQPNLYAFVDLKNGMSKDQAAELIQHYQSSGTVMDDHHQRDPPIQNACYILRYRHSTDCRGRKNTEGCEYEDNCGGYENMEGDLIFRHKYYLKLGPKRKTKKNQDKNRTKFVFTFIEPINLQVIHYTGNWPLADEVDEETVDAPVDHDNSGNNGSSFH